MIEINEQTTTKVGYPETCEYILELDDFNTWKCSKCELLWHLAADTPIENEMYYCPKCGRKIIREVTQN